MLKREAIRAVNFLLRRGAMVPSRMSFVLNKCNDVSVVERDGRHDDTLYYNKGVTLYFDHKGKEVSKTRFDHMQVLADAAEAYMHPDQSSGEEEMGL